MISYSFDSDEYLVVFSGKADDLPESILDEYHVPLDRAVYLNQTHSDNVVIHKDISLNKYDDADAVVSNIKNVPLMIRTADCVPIMLIDSVRKVVAGIHSGVKGTMKSIVIKTLKAMCDEYGTDSHDVRAFIGPCVHKCCYTIDQNYYKQIDNLNNKDKVVETIENGFYSVDLVEYNRQLLFQSGIKKDAIEVVNSCTGCNPELFYSYRKRKDEGRMYSFVYLKE